MAISASLSLNQPKKHYQSGEVGLLGEEIPQRLLSILIESATACLNQIHTMSMQHGMVKAANLYKVGLNVVAHWDNDVILEEIVRIETLYPEVMALHSYSYLWLLDTLFSDKEISNIAVPALPDLYSIFIRRVVQQREVVSDVNYIKTPISFQRLMFVDAFRNSYHDLIQKSARQARFQVSFSPKRENTSGVVEVTADDAPSEVAARLSAGSNISKTKADKIHSQRQKVENLTVVNLKEHEQGMNENIKKNDAENAERDENAEKETIAASKTTAKTKELIIKGPCFFNQNESKETEKINETSNGS